MSDRRGEIQRTTAETDVTVRVEMEGVGKCAIRTGMPFLDHMLAALGKHGGINMAVTSSGDLDVDDHHTVEDCALALGMAIDQALGDRRGITRFGYAYAPLDEALARAVVDLSGRPFARIDLGLKREKLGTVSCENLTHFLSSISTAMRATVHIDVLRGDNDHHRVEAAFKALALALKQAAAKTASNEVPSTKGTLT